MRETKMNNSNKIKSVWTKIKDFCKAHKYDITEALIIGAFAGFSNYIGQKTGFKNGRKLGNWEGILSGTRMPDSKLIQSVKWIPDNKTDILEDKDCVASLEKLGLNMDDVAKINKVYNVVSNKDVIM